MTWFEIEIKTTLESEEAVTEFLYDAGAKGVVIESGDNIEMLLSDPTVNFIDEKILNMDVNSSNIKGYFHQESDLSSIVEFIKSKIIQLPEFGLDPGSYEINVGEVEEEDWANSWKQFYKPTKIGKNIVIKPIWEAYEADTQNIIVNIDPGMAFGTGTHETTRLCIEALEKEIHTNDILYDIGCGTGILGVVACKLGCQSVVGIDLDPVAIQVAKDNIEMNQVSDQIEIRLGNLVDVLKNGEVADVVVANILAEAIVDLSDVIRPFLKDKGVFISSGIINDRLEMVLESLDKNGFSVKEINTQDEWNCVIAIKNEE